MRFLQGKRCVDQKNSSGLFSGVGKRMIGPIRHGHLEGSPRFKGTRGETLVRNAIGVDHTANTGREAHIKGYANWE